MTQLFVWRGNHVLKNYSTGMVVVAAEDQPTAWAKLRADEPGAWLQLYHGYRSHWIDNGEELERELASEDFAERDIKTDFPVHPEVYALAELPVLVKWGGE